MNNQEEFERREVGRLMLDDHLFSLAGLDIGLLGNFQYAHDFGLEVSLEYWEIMMVKIAKTYNLKYTPA